MKCGVPGCYCFWLYVCVGQGGREGGREGGRREVGRKKRGRYKKEERHKKHMRGVSSGRKKKTN